ncbi:MAG: hypothetical protein IMHGJWDQ_001026 [Candidatus Fervidibacter sp.]
MSAQPITLIVNSELRRYIEANWGRIMELFSPYHAIAFGSRVNGTAREDSDIDLIVVSETLGVTQDIVELCELLTEDFPQTRYPDVAGMPPFLYFDAAVARKPMEQAERIRNWVVQQLRHGDGR